MKKFISATLSILIISLAASARSNPKADLDAFRSASANGTPGVSAYESLYRAFEGYRQMAATVEPRSDMERQCRSALLEIYPRLADGAYFYASANDKEAVLRFACAYVDVSLVPFLDSDGLQRSSQYPVLSNLAATNLYNRREYERSIRYFQAYLESGDPTNRERAFEGLARCYFEKKDYGYAANICHQATQFYPRNWNLLIIGIESAGHNGNDSEMGQMLSRAIALQPGHKGLWEYQGKLHERQKRYVDAAAAFERVCAGGNASLDQYSHLAFNYYNAATLLYTKAMSEGRATTEANAMFKKAAPLLKTVLDAKPFAANVARALAFCYSATSDATRLQEANNTLATLHSPTVDFGALPTLERNYTPSVELNPVSAAETSSIARGEPDRLIADVDINIPETGLKRNNTCVVIISNEEYYNKDIPKVDFARRDGEIFREYCRKTLGVPDEQIHFCTDAPMGIMKKEVDYLQRRCGIDPGKVDVIFYYAGHGLPNPTESRSYLLPYDGENGDYSTCYDLEHLYAQFDAMNARSVTVFLDACFSGRKRGNGMISAGRYVHKKEADVKAKGNTVVFSAASNDEAALPYDEKGHGMFTYHLLKILQESRGDITLDELGRRLSHDVSLKVMNMNKKQTPNVHAAAGLGSSWKSRRLID
ncbi:MAG: caspase family protein [Muribaculaceae bacterium]|nr:caspase family protein [Muribaculaceae bacterium]